MARTRKKYLVFKKAHEGENRVLGIFSSRKKADMAVSEDASRTGNQFVCRALCLERTKGGARLIISAGHNVQYEVSQMTEDQIYLLKI